jgi:2-polyprenyl-3-methyl-5-hydroxy-6-metoxy-1,4-benzoquinol methylase
VGALDATADLLQPRRFARVVRRRAAVRLYPELYRLRGRIPHLNLHEQARRFYERAEQLGLGDLRAYSWYHTIDLGQGLVTPGTYDHRKQVPAFHFPQDMRGMDVLDVGSATGFFAFEFERRGANVVSVEVPSIGALDRFPFEEPQDTLKKIAYLDHRPASETAEEVYHYVIDGPFKFCHKVLGSRVERRYTPIYDLEGEFDLVFVGDVLLHTLHPVEALAAIAKVCKGTLALSQNMPERFSQPAMLYVGGDTLGDPNLAWWIPNQACLQQLLKKLGFAQAELVGYNSGVMRPAGIYYDRPILHARK